MLSAIIATHELERDPGADAGRAGPGATPGMLGEVIVADAGSRDATAEVADIAGCRFIASSEPLGARLKAAAARAHAVADVPARRLRAGARLGSKPSNASSKRPQPDDPGRAAVFRPPGVADLLRPGLAELIALMRVTLGGGAGLSRAC